jgi:outer membrane protein assembly factor BamB
MAYLAAFDAATGAVLWTNDLRSDVNYAMSSPPTAAGGTVFVTGSGIGGRVFAIAADTGSLRWTSNVWSGDDSSPAVVPEAIITSSACEQVLAMAPDSGCLLWQYVGPCVGGGGGTAVIQGERVWVIGPTFPMYETTNEVLDRRTGAGIRRFETMRSPALDGDYGYFTDGAKLEKAAVDSGDVVWTFEGDDGLRAPILANGHAYVVSTTGMLYAIDLQTGVAVWSEKVADWISSDSETTGTPRFGLAAGEDHLVVPGRTVLVAYH